jgi:hypothetical protein
VVLASRPYVRVLTHCPGVVPWVERTMSAYEKAKVSGEVYEAMRM